MEELPKGEDADRYSGIVVSSKLLSEVKGKHAEHS